MYRFNLSLALLLLLPAGRLAAQTGGDLPPLEIENVTVVGKRVVVLPKARKGEVADTAIYVLPPGDTMLFGERISNLGGTAGSLPGYREYERPLKIDAEASIGSYLSPHLRAGAEFIRRKFDVGGLFDFRSTAGHIDSAEASSLLLGLHGSVLLGDDVEPLRGLRVGGEFEHVGDGYFLYGNSINRFDRSRIGNQGSIIFRSEEELPIGYAIKLHLEGMSVEDTRPDTTLEASAMSPALDLDLGGKIDSSWSFRLGAGLVSTSLRYATPANTPLYLTLNGEAELRAAPGTFLTAGIVVASGENSDSGSSSLIMPRASVRYEASSTISLFGWFSPELRAASYRQLIMRAPYVDRDITLRPERVPVRFAAGVRVALASATVEARGFYESAENTPVVAAVGAPGELRYLYVSSKSVGAAASARIRVTPSITVDADALIRSVSDSADRELPMTPSVDLRGRADFALTPRINIFGSLVYQTDQRTALSDSTTTGALTVPARFLLGAGASYGILEDLDAFAEISNLLGYSYDLWQNYSAPGFEIRAGVRGRF
jgi:outer membrane receptor protein involved in Fe transport